MQLHSGHQAAKRYFTEQNASSYDRIVRFTTFGRDIAWKKNILSVIAEHDKILELACGTGILSQLILRRPLCLGSALDISYHYLHVAKQKGNLPLVQGNAEILPYRDGVFGAVVSSYLAKYADLDLLLSECNRVLDHGGVVVFHDFIPPSSWFFFSLWRGYFYLLRALGLFVPAWNSVFVGLQSTIEKSEWITGVISSLQAHGFRDITCKRMTFETAAIVTGKKL